MKITKWDGKPVSKPGIYRGVPIERYHGPGICVGPSVSSSGLRLCWSKSAAHFFDEWKENPDRQPRKATEPMTLGSAAHHLLLGEDDFSVRFIGRPDTIRDDDGDLVEWHGNRIVCKDWLKAQAKAGRTVLMKSQLEAIRGMALSLSKDPLVKAGALNGEIECSMFAQDPETGIWLCARPDAIPTDSGNFSDIKTAEDTSDDGIFRALRNYGLQQQGAMIWELCDLLKIPFEDFNLVFVESARPFCVRVVPLTEEDLSRGRRQNRMMLRRIAQCIKDKVWPGPGFGVPIAIGLPNSLREYIDNKLTLLGAEHGEQG